MLPSLLQDLIMVPMHAVEGLSVRYGLFRSLYRTIAPVYGRSRASHYFGEDLFLDQKRIRFHRRVKTFRRRLVPVPVRKKMREKYMNRSQ